MFTSHSVLEPIITILGHFIQVWESHPFCGAAYKLQGEGCISHSEDGSRDGNMILGHFQLTKLALALWSLVYTISSVLLTTPLGLSRSDSILATLELSQSYWKHLVVPLSQQDIDKLCEVSSGLYASTFCKTIVFSSVSMTFWVCKHLQILPSLWLHLGSRI